LISNDDLEIGKLVVESKIKPDKVFSANKSLIRLRIGKVREEILGRILGMLSEITNPN
jgi:hypothetical protein